MTAATTASATSSVARHLRTLLPGRADLAPVRTSWRRDLLAGVTVAVVALPLALGFGISSGMGAAAGLVTAVVAGVVAAVLGGSHVQVSGPTGAMAVILAPIVAAHGTAGVVTISVMAGIVLVLAGLARLGRIVVYIPWPVIEGFTAGIAAIIFLQQVPLALDVTVTGGERPLAAALDAVGQAGLAQSGTALGVTVGVILVIELCRRLPGNVPGALVAVGLATGAAQVLHLDISRIGALPTSLPAPSLGVVDPATLAGLAGPALSVAALAAIESLLSARVAAGMAPTGRPLPDRELVGQGMASIASGVFGGMPATGAIARTAVNVRAGAQSRLAAVVHALCLALVVLVGAGLASLIPLAALAGVLIATAFRMVNVREATTLLRLGRGPALTFLVTIVCTVALDLITAVEVGIVLAGFFALRRMASTSRVEREALPGPACPGDEHISLLRLDGSLFFGAADRVLDEIADSRAWVVILRLSQVNLLDSTGAHRLMELMTQLEARGITVLIKGIRPEHHDTALRAGVLGALRHQAHLFEELPPAVEHARDHVRRELAHRPTTVDRAL
ncbi:SulP family inorganic anion transporter [Miniimonas sp. S16]|uniref:SulP family inorganic anion transporter n=1 Tax=Miniimonas sp. S16 TaxID=2171623 RepID=UPI000D526E82|nr:SulP family inorganic anion transporter [Miniimonas sp. S16]